MQVTVETRSGLGRRMHVEVPENRISGEIHKRLQKLAGDIRLPGFRPGKVPMKVVQQRFGSQVRNEVVGEIVQSSFVDALQQEKLRPAGTPDIDPLDFKPGEGLKYTAEFDVYPEITLPPLESLKITRPNSDLTDADVGKMLETLRKQRRNWVSVARAATASDRVVVDFEGFMDEKPVENAKGSEFPVELDGNRMIPGFEAGLVGTLADEEKILDLNFPETYHAAELAGRAVRFKIKVLRVEEPSLPELDDEFAKSFGVSEGGMDKLHEEVRENMQRELAEVLRNRAKQATLDALLAAQVIELPEALVDEECKQAMQRQLHELEHSGVDPKDADLNPEMFQEQARNRVTLGLVLAEVIKENDIKPDSHTVRERIQAIASTYEQPEEVVKWYYGSRERLMEVETSVLEDQVVDWIMGKADVSVEMLTFDDLMNPGQTS